MLHAVEITKNHFYINGIEINYPTTLEFLKPILGDPSRILKPNNSYCWGLIWDDIGIMCTCGLFTYNNIFDIQFHTAEWDKTQVSFQFDTVPEKYFMGELKINGEVQLPEKEYIPFGSLDFFKYHWGFNIMQNIDLLIKVPKKKFILKPVTEDDIVFVDFNFKLLIIQELMYVQQLLKPLFNLDEFIRWSKDKGVEIDDESTVLIPETVQYFKDLPIPKKLATKVNSIRQDGGNEIYRNLIPQWDGEDGIFDVLVYDDVVHFPKLKKIVVLETAYWKTETAEKQNKAIQFVKDRNIEVSFL